MLQSPLESAVLLPSIAFVSLLARYTMALPGAPAPVNVGVVSVVTLSVDELPVSLASVKSIVIPLS